MAVCISGCCRPLAGTEQNQQVRMSPVHRGSPIWVQKF
ncbi:unnamed protein product [Staurois parvus]|uniref:Uncharacterized protein n=1 Tax=Staurois parvus TaxID=386267 RepID=A0ABN9CJ14_9NEOB|nr:unnamed protein product [Staurois parvus]